MTEAAGTGKGTDHRPLVRRAMIWLDRPDKWKKILTLGLLALLVYGTASGIVWSSINDYEANTDIDLYQSRTQAILDGKLLYKDVHTESPPVINYIFLPAQILGGGDNPGVYVVYVCTFAFLLSTLMYIWLRGYDERRAFMVGAMALLCPFMIDESMIGEDGSIVAFIFILGSLLMLSERGRSSTTVVAIGVWTKMWPVLLLPIQFLRATSWRRRMEIVFIVSLVTLLIIGPYLILCFDEFLDFLSYYFLGKSGRTNEGLSMFNFLRDGGLTIPTVVELGIVLLALLGAYLYAYKEKWGPWKSATLVMVVFILVYPKMHVGYYIMPMLLLLIWAVDDWKIAARLFLAFIPLSQAVGFLPGGEPLVHVGEWNWVIGFLLALIGTLLFVDAMRVSFKRTSFINE